jgi:hypothetical protein
VLDVNIPAPANAQSLVFGTGRLRHPPGMWHLRLRLVERHAEFGQAGFLAFPRLGTHPLAQNAVKAY